MSWEERYNTGDTPWDKGAPAPPLLDLLSSKPNYFTKGTILVPGCGKGHDALAIARAGHQVIGLDLSPTALLTARELDPDSAVEYREADFLTSQKSNFADIQAIFEHTCLCAISPNEREAYRDACARLLPKGGLWIAIIFVSPREEDDPTTGPPFQTKLTDVEELFSPCFTLVDSYTPKNTFTARKGKEQVMVWQKS